MKVEFEQVYDGEWVTPLMRGWRMKCCDCGLVHRVEFRVKGERRRHVQFRAWVEEDGGWKEGAKMNNKKRRRVEVC